MSLKKNVAKKTTMDEDSIEIKCSALFSFLCILIILLILLLVNISLWLNFNTGKYSIVLLGFIPFHLILGYALYKFSKNRFQLAKFSVAEGKIIITFQKNTYFENTLTSIKGITIFKYSIEGARTPHGFTNYYEGHSIQFTCQGFIREIMLWSCGFNVRKQYKIIDALTDIGKKLNIPVKIYDAQSILIKRE